MKTLLSLGLLIAVAWLARPASAATFTVSTTADGHSQGFSSQGAPNSSNATTDGTHTSLRSALEFASTQGGSATINLPAGTYNLSLGDLVAGVQANTTIYIHGMGTSGNTTINQTQSGRMIMVVNYNVNANVVVGMDNVTITGGSENENDPDGFGGNGGAILAGGSATASGNALGLTNVVFSGNYCSPVSNAGATGGAINMTGGGNLNVVGCTFTDNNASKLRGVGYGGAINFDNGANPGNVVISGSYFSGNIAPGATGGALSLAGGTAGTFTITGCTFVNNTCVSGTTYGGAIYAVSGNLTGSFNRFTGNIANSGGAVYVGNNAGTTGDLRNNWWGANGGPNTTGSDTTFPTTSSALPLSHGQVSFNPWIVLTHTANPGTILTSTGTTLTAGFTTNSAGTQISASNLGALIGLPITFNNPVKGTLSSPQATIQASGTATATFTAGTTPGAGSADAKVDNGIATAAITIKAPATVTGVSTTTANGSYTVGATITITVTFSEAVTVTGTPKLALNSGGTATYNSGSGTLTLTFTYTVGAGQQTPHLDYISTSALTLNGGTITDALGNNATLALAAPGMAGSLGANTNIAIVIQTVATTTTVSSSANPSVSGQSVTFTATVASSGAGTPTGTVQFKIDGSNFGSPVTLVGGQASSAAISTLSVAGSPHAVTALYSGDANFTSSAPASPLLQSVIAPPTAGPDSLGTTENTPVNAPVAKLLANDSSPTAGPLSITAVTSPSTQGGTVVLNGGFVTYTPAHNFIGPDTFTYTLSDTHATAQGTVTITVSPDGQTLNTISITGTLPNVTLTFAGIPGQIYVVQWATSATGPWTDFSDGTIAAGATGLVQYTDSTQPPPPVRFFRTRIGTPP